MATTDRRIEIFAPFGEALDLTKKILFQPFDIGKWFVIGLGAWLATFFTSGGFRYNYNTNNSKWHWQAWHQGPSFSWHDLPPWVMPVALFVLLFVLAFIALMIWLNARGRFIFTDCIVRNRAAVVEPWREYRVEADSFFVFQLIVALCAMIAFGAIAVIFLMSWVWGPRTLPIALFACFFLAWFLLIIFVNLVTRFMVPVMYRQRCRALEAFRIVWRLLLANLAVFILFVLFNLVIYVAAFLLSCIAGCATCCLAMLPYLGTVILLPIVMPLYALPLCFLRQFGDAYDVWAVVRPIEPALPPVPPPEIPPAQETPPPAGDLPA